jgi:hypothetical protein
MEVNYSFWFLVYGLLFEVCGLWLGSRFLKLFTIDRWFLLYAFMPFCLYAFLVASLPLLLEAFRFGLYSLYM